MRKRVGRSISVLAMTLAIGSAALPAFAHLHTLDPDGDGQPLKTGQGEVVYLANGQNHPRFVAVGDGTFESCESYGPIPGSEIGPAWYGLETAHHGPDSGDPGKADGCYVADGNPALGEDDQNPAIG